MQTNGSRCLPTTCVLKHGWWAALGLWAIGSQLPRQVCSVAKED